MGNNPVNRFDPDGGFDWYRNNQTNDVVWIDGSAEVDGFTHLSANALDPSVIGAISSSIQAGGFDKFLEYFNNSRLGSDYFFDLSNTFDFPREGWLASLIDNSLPISDAFHISEWTHSSIANGTEANNALEHHIGTVLMTNRWGPGSAGAITTANEIRGLIINDRQSGRMLDALRGRPGTAFEWKDIGNNIIGGWKYTKWHFSNYVFNRNAWFNDMPSNAKVLH
ncbi:hypothetical protein AAG747_25280 [Rapidithrix thailandica]|uniref:Uncharacterized protein n=1 Tax=Rapidithrix thailandica TaxID=413964 RepID=A0AAW9SHH1_9BACT